MGGVADGIAVADLLGNAIIDRIGAGRWMRLIIGEKEKNRNKTKGRNGKACECSSGGVHFAQI
jgi:hypothetical protein